MAFFVGHPLVSGTPTSVHTSAENALGTVVQDNGNNVYIYLKGVASTVAGDLVVYDEVYQTTRATNATPGNAAIAMAAVVANTFGWYLVDGSTTLNVVAAVADNAELFASATAGQADDDSVGLAGAQIISGFARTAAGGAGSITAQIRYPVIGVNVA